MTKHILIVDDEERIREVVRACLEDLGGWQTMAAASALEGLERARETPFDAILLDMSMPDVDGTQFLENLHSLSLGWSIPVILLTAKSFSGDIRSYLTQLGVVGIITKPFNPLTLPQRITQLLAWSP